MPRRRVTFQVEVTQACSTAEDGRLAEQRPGRRERVAEKVPWPHGGEGSRPRSAGERKAHRRSWGPGRAPSGLW